MTDTSPLVRTDRWTRDAVDGATLTLNRPEHRNPIDHDTVRVLLHALRELRTEVQVVVVTGAGTAFSAGGDLRGYLDLYTDPVAFRGFLEDFAALCAELEQSPLVTCAMVNGACVAGGLELALACDLLTASSEARIGDGHLGSGQLPGAGGSQRLVRAIGVQRAKGLLLSPRLITATDAHHLGLVHEVWGPDELLDRTLDHTASMAQASRLGYAQMKELIQIAQSTDLEAGLAAERELVWHYATTSHDAREGLHAFLERRPSRYSGA